MHYDDPVFNDGTWQLSILRQVEKRFSCNIVVALSQVAHIRGGSIYMGIQPLRGSVTLKTIKRRVTGLLRGESPFPGYVE